MGRARLRPRSERKGWSPKSAFHTRGVISITLLTGCPMPLPGPGMRSSTLWKTRIVSEDLLALEDGTMRLEFRMTYSRRCRGEVIESGITRSRKCVSARNGVVLPDSVCSPRSLFPVQVQRVRPSA